MLYVCSQLETTLTSTALSTLTSALGDIPVSDCKALLHSTIPNLIAVNWEPEGGENMLEAMVKKVVTRFPAHLTDKASIKKAVKLNTLKVDGSNTRASRTRKLDIGDIANVARQSNSSAETPRPTAEMQV
eukprot:1954501-Prymnesium_polylepis.2